MERWKTLEDEIIPEINELEVNGELGTQKRYLANYKRMSGLLSNYVSLLAEDRIRISGAGARFAQMEAEILKGK